MSTIKKITIVLSCYGLLILGNALPNDPTPCTDVIQKTLLEQRKQVFHNESARQEVTELISEFHKLQREKGVAILDHSIDTLTKNINSFAKFGELKETAVAKYKNQRFCWGGASTLGCIGGIMWAILYIPANGWAFPWQDLVAVLTSISSGISAVINYAYLGNTSRVRRTYKGFDKNTKELKNLFQRYEDYKQDLNYINPISDWEHLRKIKEFFSEMQLLITNFSRGFQSLSMTNDILGGRHLRNSIKGVNLMDKIEQSLEILGLVQNELDRNITEITELEKKIITLMETGHSFEDISTFLKTIMEREKNRTLRETERILDDPLYRSESMME